jgi:hypothetical protein
MKQVLFYLDENKLKELKHICVDKETTVAEVMRSLAEIYIEKNK